MNVKNVFVWGNPLKISLCASLLAFALLVSGCSDSAITEVAHIDDREGQPKIINEPVPNHNEPPKELVSKFGDKAERFLERVYGLPWSELSQMEVSELSEINSDLSYEQALEDWEELQGLIKELDSYDGAMRDVMRLNEAFAAGERPEDISFGFYGASEFRKINGCEDACYAEADRKLADLYRSHWIASTECGAYGAVASVFATPAAGMFTFGVCGLFAILKYQEAERVIREELDLCLMVCNIPVEDVG